MTVDFQNYFWGEKLNGYNVLYHNMKNGLIASKEFNEVLKERSNIEENTSKHLAKLAKQVGNCTQQGTFAPLWQVLKSSVERLSALHIQMVQKISDLTREITNYTEELQKKQKMVKDEEGRTTVDAVQAMQNISSLVQKSKDIFEQRGADLDRLRTDNASTKDIEKNDGKFRKAYEEYRMHVERYIQVKATFEEKMCRSCDRFQDIELAHLGGMKKFLHTYADVVDWQHDEIGRINYDFRRQCDELTVDNLLQQFVATKSTGLERPGIPTVDDIMLPSHTNICTSKGVQKSNTASASNIASNIVTTVTATNTSSVTNVPTTTNSNNTKIATATSSNQTSISISSTTSSMNKPSRRTTSLLNLFMSNSHGSRESRAGPCSAPSSPTTPSGDPQLARHSTRGSKWFLRSRRDKSKKKSKKKSRDNSDAQPQNKECSSVFRQDMDEFCHSICEDDVKGPAIDEEGFIIRPSGMPDWRSEKSSFYSSSDTDSDDGDHKIHVKIKPLNNNGVNSGKDGNDNSSMSASMDELRATVGNLFLAPSTMATISGGMRGTRWNSTLTDSEQMQRSQSIHQQIGSGEPSFTNDLFDLNNTVQSSTNVSNASTPTGSNPYTPLQSPTQLQTARTGEDLVASDGGSEIGVGASTIVMMSPNKMPTKQTATPTTTSITSIGSISIPRPPSRRSNPMSRVDSVNSIELRTTTAGISRGPSPLTIGMSDTIPLAVAFHEIIHSYFRGSDETRCQVKMSGEMMLSFPAGIVSVLANNPNPAKLVFSLKNAQRLINVMPNKQVIINDVPCKQVATATDNILLEFDMISLTALLRKQYEQNTSASYFNVDILKYQVKPLIGANSCPFQLVAYWKCQTYHTDLKIDYKYNSHAMHSATPLLNLFVSVPIKGDIKNMHAKPPIYLASEANRLVWKFTELSQHSDNSGVGSMLARFDVENVDVNTPTTISTSFNCEGTTLSGIDFQLVGSGYRLSLVKRRFISGKYICDGDMKYSAGSGLAVTPLSSSSFTHSSQSSTGDTCR